MSDSILDEVREILQKSSTTSFGQGYVIGLVAELEATQGVLSRVQEARADDIARAEKAEADVARLTKMVGWFAKECAGGIDECPYLSFYQDVNAPERPKYCTCSDTEDGGFDCSEDPTVCWLKEAARRAVAGGEE